MGEAACTVETFTAGDGYRWRYRHYPAAGAARAQVICIHGIQSHGAWYEHSCTRLAQEGYEVSFLDRRGSGMNEEERGDAPSFRRLLDDIAEYLITLKGCSGSPSPLYSGERGWGEGAGLSRGSAPSPPTPLPRVQGRGERKGQTLSGKPRILLAISWGGKLAVALQRRHPGLVDGLALLCPGFFPRVRPPLRERLRIAWSALTAPTRLFPVPLNEPELFTASPHWQQFIRDDPLALREATARLLLHSVRLDGYLRFVPKYVAVPVLLLLAERDRIIYNEPTRRFVARFASADKEIIEYPGAHHTLEFEPDPEVFLRDLTRWLARVAR